MTKEDCVTFEKQKLLANRYFSIIDEIKQNRFKFTYFTVISNFAPSILIYTSKIKNIENILVYFILYVIVSAVSGILGVYVLKISYSKMVVKLSYLYDQMGMTNSPNFHGGFNLTTKRLPTFVGRIFNMILQVLKYDIFCDRTIRSRKVPSSPKPLAPIALLQHRKFLLDQK